MRVVYLPEFKKRVEKQYPGATVTCQLEEGYVTGQARLQLLRQAWFERERIPDDHLH